MHEATQQRMDDRPDPPMPSPVPPTKPLPDIPDEPMPMPMPGDPPVPSPGDPVQVV
jgi:hypothetical protein